MTSKALTILIVDDSPEDRETYKAYLEQHEGYIFTFLEEEDAEKGLETCNQVEIDCILLDYHLPGVDGINFLKQLQQIKRCQEVPIVMITGRGSEYIAVESLKMGASDYLVKSDINSDNLFRATKNAIDKSLAARELEKQIKQRQKAEEEMARSEERLRLLIEAVKDYALIMLDTEGKVVSWNSGASRILGYHASEIIGHNIRKIFTQKDIKSQESEIELQVARKTGRAENERWYIKRSGEEFWASGIVRPIHDLAGTCIGYVKILKDQTEQRMTENQLREAVLALNEAIHERDEFLSIASHELKTPMTAMKLNLQMAWRNFRQKGELDRNKIAEFFQRTDTYVSKLSYIIEELLDVSRINEKRLSLNPSSFDVSSMLEEVITQYEELLKNAGCKIHKEITPGVHAFLDRKRIEQVLVNLIANAARFAPNNPVKFILEADNNFLKMKVQDFGCGIPEEKLHRFFEKFERFDHDRNHSGLGLGLFISKSIIMAHGGTIHATSAPNEGCTFSISLPLKGKSVDE